METPSAVWSQSVGAWKADLSIVLEYLCSLQIFADFEVPWYVPLAEGALK